MHNLGIEMWEWMLHGDLTLSGPCSVADGSK
jgi:hypothetical protein